MAAGAITSGAAGDGALRAVRRGPAPRAVLAIASLGASMAFIDATIVNIAFPDIERSFPSTPISTLSWVLNAYNIVFATFLVAAGRMADLIGRRRAFAFGLELFTAGSLLCALAPSAGLLIAFRVVQALGAAFIVPASLGLVLHAFPLQQRAHGVAMLSAVGAAAAGLGPSLGGLLVQADDWRLVFLVNLPAGVAAMVLARRRLVESRSPGRRRMPDVAGTLLFAAATATLVLGVTEGQSWGWGSVRAIGCFAAAIVLGGAFAWRSARHRAPAIDLSLLRIPTFSAANGATVIGAAGFYGYTLANVLFLTDVWRYSVLQAGLAMTVGPLVAFAIAAPTSRLVERVGPRPVLVAGGLMWGGAVMWFVARAGARPDFAGEWLPGMVMLGIGAGTLFPNISAAAVASVPGDSYATATAMNAVARQVGAAVGVAILVAILDAPSASSIVTTFHHAWSFGAICLFTSGLVCVLVRRIDMSKAPALADAARSVSRVVLVNPAPDIPLRPRRRMALLDPAAPAIDGPQLESTGDFLGLVPIFAGLAEEHRARLATRCGARRLNAGEWLFHQGDPGDALYVVRAGRLEVVSEPAGSVLRVLGRGDAVGELALLTELPRAASVRATRASDLIAVDRGDFEKLLTGAPELALALSRSLALQLRQFNAAAPMVRPVPTTVALVEFDQGVPVRRLAEDLARELGRGLSIAVLDPPDPQEAPPRSEPIALYGPRLDRTEATHDLVVLVAGSACRPTGWTDFCLQQADRILAVTAGGPIPRALERREALRGCDLVAHDAAPGALAGWGQLLDPVESHLVRGPERAEDLARLARRLTGRSVGIVLSGGGARAFAHIGVLEELERAGARIDRVAGVSMGALIGALFAMGREAEEIDAWCFEEWVQRRPLSDYTVPRHGLIRGERARAMLQRMFGSRLIEELPRSFMSGCAELRSGHLVMSRHGPLWEAVGLSICLPIIAAPQVRGSDLLIDGSLVDNLPVGTMAEMGEGPIVAVDVRAAFRSSRGAGAADGAPPRPPSLAETVTRVLLLGSENTGDAARRHAQLVIQPVAYGIGLLEFHQLDAAREAGRAAARKALEQAPDWLFA